MPQTLDGAWHKALGSEFAAVHEMWLHTIGNLTLSSYNSELWNHAFEEKRELLKKSGFAMNQRIAESTEWTATTIEDRGRALADLAVKVWGHVNPGA